MSRMNQWFVVGDGIAREVITADIQRYLGPDALVRPGTGTGEYEVGSSLHPPQRTTQDADQRNRAGLVIGLQLIERSHRYVKTSKYREIPRLGGADVVVYSK